MLVQFQLVAGETINTYSNFTHDFGTIVKYDENTTLNYLINVKNIDKKVYEIKEVDKSCGCTDVEVDNKKILPGKQSELDMNLDITRKDGYVIERVILIPKTTSLYTTQIYLKANIKPIMVLSQSEVNMGNIHYTEHKNVKLNMYFIKEANVKLHEIKLTNNKLMNLKYKEKENGNWWIDIQKIPDKATRGELKNNLIVQLTSPQKLYQFKC
jgi:hypothetical protein